MKLDILVMAAHPDDAELSCSGTILAQIAQGKKVGIIDFTQGELGTRGSAEIRLLEAADSAKIMGLSARENMGFRDGFFVDDEAHRLKIIKMIRKYRPEILLANALRDRHPDHARAGKLAVNACFLSGLKKVKTTDAGVNQETWRPKQIFHYVQSVYIQPDFVVDISEHWEKKEAAIKAFKTQFFDPNSTEKNTFISTPEFMEFLKARAREYGQSIQVKYGEGFTKNQQLGVKDLFDFMF